MPEATTWLGTGRGSAQTSARGTTALGNERPTFGLVTAILLFDLYVICGRAPELLYILALINVPLWPTLLNILGFMMGFFGDMRNALASKTSLFLLLFTAWILVALPFSVHRGGSMDVLLRSWLPSLLTFYVVSANIQSLALLRKSAVLIGLCSFQIAVISFFLARDVRDRFSMAVGTLANANDLSALLLYGTPFLIFLAIRPAAKVWIQMFAGALSALVLVLVLRTGSRSGVLTILLMAALGMLWSTWQTRVKIVAGALLSIMVAIPLVPSYSLQRIGTLVQDSTDATLEAEYSRESRTQLFLTSLRLAAEHPLFGVGLGEFQAAEYLEAKESGRQGRWLAPHNTLGQVASENGFPGLFFFVAFVVVVLWRADRARRQWKQMQGRNEQYYLAMSLELALIGYVFNSLFGSNAYLPYLPALAGLSDALTRITEGHFALFQNAGARREVPKPAHSVPVLLPASVTAPAQPRASSIYRMGDLRRGTRP